MPLYKFKRNDIFYNQIKAYPQCDFFIYSGSTYYNNNPHLRRTAGDDDDAFIKHVPAGFVSLYELNVDRDASLHTYDPDAGTGTKSLIFPFLTKDGSLSSFKTISTSQFNTDFAYGDEITGSYPLSASISKIRYAEGAPTSSNGTDSAFDMKKPHIYALRNTLNYYTKLSPHYAYSSSYNLEGISHGGWDKGFQELGLLSIPSIFYGSSIKRGSVSLKFYITGTLIGELQDEGQNGALVQVAPTGSLGSGSVAGVVLYNEGFIVLTGSWDISDGDHEEIYANKGTGASGGGAFVKSKPQWVYFGSSIDPASINDVEETAFKLSFKGVNYIPTITMLAHAEEGKLNLSSNPTYVEKGQALGAMTSSVFYKEPTNVKPKNTISSSFHEHTASFMKQTYISKVGIFDDDKNLIGIAKLATPVRKREDDAFTFKLKLDV